MKQRLFFIFTSICLSAVTLSGCGMYVGSPPSKTEVRETTTPAPEQPPTEVHVYNPPPN